MSDVGSMGHIKAMHDVIGMYLEDGCRQTRTGTSRVHANGCIRCQW